MANLASTLWIPAFAGMTGVKAGNVGLKTGNDGAEIGNGLVGVVNGGARPLSVPNAGSRHPLTTNH